MTRRLFAKSLGAMMLAVSVSFPKFAEVVEKIIPQASVLLRGLDHDGREMEEVVRLRPYLSKLTGERAISYVADSEIRWREVKGVAKACMPYDTTYYVAFDKSIDPTSDEWATALGPRVLVHEEGQSGAQSIAEWYDRLAYERSLGLSSVPVETWDSESGMKEAS